MLDNMTPEKVAEAIGMIKGRAVVEVSGGITIENVGAYAASGADLISAGVITNSAPNLDIGLDLE
jgi:nicotinate-nucleotide pyrophosphorylase (carboxylating)